jgi:hypothetical protein
MINYEQLEDAALCGIEESLDNDLANSESGWLPEDEFGNNKFKDYCGEEIAEAIYCCMLGYTN